MGHNKQHKGNPLTAKQLKDLKAKEEEQIKKAKAANEKNPQFGREEYKKMYGKYPTHEYGKKIPNAMNKQAYALKPVPEGNKGKGLSKLPEKVRNKMGYMMDSSHSFKSNVANNMKTMYMGSVYSMSHLKDAEVGDVIANPETGTLQEVKKIEEKDVVKDVFKDNYQGGGTFKNQAERDWYNDQIKQRTDKGMSQQEAIQDYRNTFKIGKKKREKSQEITKVKVPELGEMKQTFDAGTNFQRRQQDRGAQFQERKIKRGKIKIAGLENRLSKVTPGSARAKKLQAKLDMQRNLAARRDIIAGQTEMQERQGIIGSGKDRIERNFTSADQRSATGRDVRKDAEAMGMKLPPKAMMYFNRKNNKK